MNWIPFLVPIPDELLKTTEEPELRFFRNWNRHGSNINDLSSHWFPLSSRRKYTSCSASSTSTTCARGCPSSSGGRERFGSIAKVRLPHNHRSQSQEEMNYSGGLGYVCLAINMVCLCFCLVLHHLTSHIHLCCLKAKSLVPL